MKSKSRSLFQPLVLPNEAPGAAALITDVDDLLAETTARAG